MLETLRVLRNDIGQAEVVRTNLPELPDGAVRLSIEAFALTSNNVTYAAMGDSFGYWNFFPGDGAWGVVPVWGHARVSESRHSEIAIGERVYGYLPMASSLDVIPGNVTARGFVDSTGHRQPMSPIYNQYTRLSADPEHDPAHEDARMIFGPLFKTGFLIEAFMRRNTWFGAQSLIMTSASSKTAMGLASVAKQLSPGICRVGVTSGGNVEFVTRSQLYDTVVSYDDIGALQSDSAVVVDFSANSGLLSELDKAIGATLRYASLVGATHHDAGRALSAEHLIGPKPELFFAPDHAVALLKELGAEAFGREFATSWQAFLRDFGHIVDMEHVSGLAQACEIYVAMVTGAIDPSKGIVVQP